MKVIGLKIHNCNECPFYDMVRKKDEAFYYNPSTPESSEIYRGDEWLLNKIV